MVRSITSLFGASKGDEEDNSDLAARDRCLVCAATFDDSDLYARYKVCHLCGFHYSMNARERIDSLADPDSFKEINRSIKRIHLDKVTTPVLIMHGAKDMTILYEEGAMMFYALRRLGKVAELVRYEEGDHSLSRHSRGDTLDVNRRMLDWFGKYLRDD